MSTTNSPQLGNSSNSVSAPATPHSGAAPIDDLSVPRSEWLSRVLRKHPDILQLRERTRPLTKAVTFGRTRGHGRTEVKETLSEEPIAKLIMQYLAEEGLESAVKAFEKETEIKYVAGEVEKEALPTLLQIGVKSLNNLFTPVMEPPADQDPEVEYHQTYVDQTVPDEVEDVNIYDEPPNGPENILIVDNQIQGGTLNKLVLWLTTSSDMDYRKAFFITHHSFTTSERLLNKLIQKYNGSTGKLNTTNSKEPSEKFTIMILLKYWFDHHPTDFNDKLLASLNNFIDNTLVKDDTGWAKGLRTVIAKMESSDPQNFSSKSNEEQSNASSREPPEPKVPKNIFSPTLTLDDIDEEEIARQLCVIDHDLYSAIKPSEFLLKSWARPQFRHKAVNLVAFLKRFNDLSKWVASVMSTERRSRTPKTKMLVRFLKICEHLKALNNFHSLMAIYIGLSVNSIKQVVRTMRKEIHNKQLETLAELDRLFSYEGSYKNYRQAYEASSSPCIPYIGVHLRDITFAEEGTPDKFNSIMINFYKRTTIWKMIDDTLRFQSIPYNYQRVHQIQVFLTNFKIDPESAIYDKAAEDLL
eukprot:TRINITY_DN3001_c0_g1_i1.p1 TRINITY_DN3001_c0_g1~~TRINITY_DN3001_c0_g1_i1.p1  ORF type:complete len:583 (-),score=79.47 TRINITY_DN3001_c0_g1_i1:85-1833(-)